jgi:hypothetical protein
MTEPQDREAVAAEVAEQRKLDEEAAAAPEATEEAAPPAGEDAPPEPVA